MGEGDSNIEEDGANAEPISLDDWQPKPASLNDWVVEDDEPQTKTTQVDLPVSAQPVSLDNWEPQPVSLDDWSPSEDPTKVEAKTEDIPPEETKPSAEPDLPEDSEQEPISLEEDDLAPQTSTADDSENDHLVIDLSEEDESPVIDLSEEDESTALDLEEPEEDIDLGSDEEDQSEEVVDVHDDSSQPEEEAISLGDESSFQDSLELTVDEPENIDTTSIELRTQTEEVHFQETDDLLPEELDHLDEPEANNILDDSFIPAMALPGIQSGSALDEEVSDDEPLTDVEEIIPSSFTDALALEENDLASSHQTPVLRLTASDLRENSQLAVIRLSESDLSSEHRVVHELEPTFFEEHGIAVNSNGVILLTPTDLAHEEEQEAPPSRSRRRTREVKESFWTNERISKYSIYAIVFCLFAIPTVYYFKYTWTTVSGEQYTEIKEETGGVDWIMKTMFKYRTEDSSFRWFGRQLLSPNAYQRAEQERSMLWLRYVNSGQAGQGDSKLD